MSDNGEGVSGLGPCPVCGTYNWSRDFIDVDYPDAELACILCGTTIGTTSDLYEPDDGKSLDERRDEAYRGWDEKFRENSSRDGSEDDLPERTESER